MSELYVVTGKLIIGPNAGKRIEISKPITKQEAIKFKETEMSMPVKNKYATNFRIKKS